MKRFFLLLYVICGLCGSSEANNFGSSVEGQEATVTFTHTADCDSARVEFGYQDTTNFYYTADALPAFSASGMILLADNVDLDSIGTHIVKITYFEDDGDATADGYVAGIWTHTEIDSNMIYRQIAYVIGPDSNVARDATKDDYKDGVGGTGSYKDTIIVLDGDTNTVEGVSITVRNASGTVVAIGETNVNGIQIFNLDAAIYTFSLQRIGIILNQDTTLTVSGNQTDTIWVTAYDIGSPPSANVTRVKGFTRTYGYQKTDRITVSFSTHDKNLIDTTSGIFIDKIAEVTYSDTGFFQIDLIPSVSLLSKQHGITKDSILYDVKIYTLGRAVFEWQNIFIPDTSGAIWLKDILE